MKKLGIIALLIVVFAIIAQHNAKAETAAHDVTTVEFAVD